MSRRPRDEQWSEGPNPSLVTGRNPGSVHSVVPYVLGIDASLTRTAAVMIPPAWELGDWNALRWMSYGEKPPNRKELSVLEYERARIERMARTARELVGFADVNVAHGGVIRGYIENYGFNMGGASTHQLPELGGIVRYMFLRELDVVLEPVAESSARKQLLGKLPKSDRKLAIELALAKAGAPFENNDVADAFTVGNLGLAMLGLTSLSLYEGTQESLDGMQRHVKSGA